MGTPHAMPNTGVMVTTGLGAAQFLPAPPDFARSAEIQPQGGAIRIWDNGTPDATNGREIPDGGIIETKQLRTLQFIGDGATGVAIEYYT